MIEIIETDAAFDALEPIWKTLERNPKMRIFQSFLWVREGWRESCIEHPANKLWILKWCQESVGDCVIFPFYIDGKGTLRFIYDNHCDSLDAVYQTGGDRNVCYHEVAEAILKNKAIKSICLHKLSGDSELLNYLGVLLRGAVIVKDNAYSWLEVQQSNDFIKSLDYMKSKDRADLKAILRKADAKRLEILSASRGDIFPEDIVRGLASAMRTSGTRAPSFFPNPLVDFARKVYSGGGTDIAILYDNDKPVALNFFLTKDNRIVSWIFLNTDNRASTELYIKYLSTECKKRSFIFDFGVGVYSYKIGTFRPYTAITCAIRRGNGHWLHARTLLEANIRFLKDYLKIYIRRGH